MAENRRGGFFWLTLYSQNVTSTLHSQCGWGTPSFHNYLPRSGSQRRQPLSILWRLVVWSTVCGKDFSVVLRITGWIDVYCSRIFQLLHLQSLYLWQHQDVWPLLPTLPPNQIYPVWSLGLLWTVFQVSRAHMSIRTCLGPDHYKLQLPRQHWKP